MSKNIENISVEIIPTRQTVSDCENRLWTGTFQLVWNDASEYYNDGKPLNLTPEIPQIAQELNEQKFTKEYLSERSYYTNFGKATKEFISEIISDLKEKFDENPSVLASVFPDGNKILFYSMLKKDFSFIYEFDVIGDFKFGQNPVLVSYFGIDTNSKASLRDNVEILFYNDLTDFALKLKTEVGDEVILWRTDLNLTFENYWSKLVENIQEYDGDTELFKTDRVRIPVVDLVQTVTFKELQGKLIKSDMISEAIETVDFRMNNKGVKLKSEAVLASKKIAPKRGTNYFFNDKFVLFMVEQGQQVPYFALRVSDIEKLNNTRK